MERIVSKRDDFVVDALFYFEPVQRFECRGDMFSFGGGRMHAAGVHGEGRQYVATSSSTDRALLVSIVEVHKSEACKSNLNFETSKFFKAHRFTVTYSGGS